MSRGPILAVCAVLCLAACGAGTKPAAAPTTKARCPATKVARALAKLQKDVNALRRAARTPTKDTRQGNAAVNRATDTFLNDVALAPIGNLKRNRMIDHAAGTLAGSCEQCFQALEAARPVVNIRFGEKRC